MNRKNEQQAWELDERPDENEEPTVQAIADVEALANDILEEPLQAEPALDSVALLGGNVVIHPKIAEGGLRLVEFLFGHAAFGRNFDFQSQFQAARR